MKGDFSRLTFDKKKHYSGVRMQQGRVQLDADWNEQLDITAHRIETEITDFIGASGAPAHPTEDGKSTSFRIAPNPDGKSLVVGKGRYYVAGKLFENDVPITLTDSTPGKKGTYIAYLDVWQQHVTVLDDSSIREVALGGPDTATRIKNQWQVKLQKLEGSVTKFKSPIPELPNGEFKARSTGRMKVNRNTSTPISENQLYRVEIHQGGSWDLATFKWSRDNGSVAVGVTRKKNTLTLTPAYSGMVSQFKQGQWVEVTNVTQRERNEPGILRRIKAVSDTTVTLKEVSEKKLTFTSIANVSHIKQDQWVEVPNEWVEVPNVTQKEGNRRGKVGRVKDVSETEVTLEDGDPWGATMDGDALSVVPGTFATAQGGSLVLAADGSYTYTPAADFTGIDSVDYTVTDGSLTDVGTLTITVTAVNDAPVAVDDAITTTEDTPFSSTVDLDFKVDVMRLWDGMAFVKSADPILLENGINVQFVPEKKYQSGDYWLIPARAATNIIEWHDGDEFQPPHGVEHAYVPLAKVKWDGSNWQVLKDKRTTFQPLATGLLSQKGNQKLDGKLFIGPPTKGSVNAQTHQLHIAGNNDTLRLEGTGVDGTGATLCFGDKTFAKLAHVREDEDDKLEVYGRNKVVLMTGDKVGKIGIDKVETPEAKLEISGILTASKNNETLIGLKVAPHFNDVWKENVTHIGLQVVIDGFDRLTVDSNGVKAKLHQVAWEKQLTVNMRHLNVPSRQYGRDWYVNWQLVDDYDFVGYYKDNQGTVHLKGRIRNGGAGITARAGVKERILRLPPGYEPEGAVTCPIWYDNGDKGRVWVEIDRLGNVVWRCLSDEEVVWERLEMSFDGITFRAKQS